MASTILGFPCPASPCIAGWMCLWLALIHSPVMLYGLVTITTQSIEPSVSSAGTGPKCEHIF